MKKYYIGDIVQLTYTGGNFSTNESRKLPRGYGIRKGYTIAQNCAPKLNVNLTVIGFQTLNLEDLCVILTDIDKIVYWISIQESYDRWVVKVDKPREGYEKGEIYDKLHQIERLILEIKKVIVD